MADADKKFELARTNVFELASFVDSQLRVMSRLYSWSDEEMEYLKNWVYKEKDPFLGTVIAQIVGFRELNQEGDEVEQAETKDKDAD